MFSEFPYDQKLQTYEKIETHAHMKTCTLIFIEALFIKSPQMETIKMSATGQIDKSDSVNL